ncbi:MAG: YceI family protein [Deltaproteobacteria bacterium]|nr:YceI family protein [Deltaproteobacteria bacterium]
MRFGLRRAAVVAGMCLGLVAANCRRGGDPGPALVKTEGCGPVTSGGGQKQYAVVPESTELLLLVRVLNRTGCGFFHPHAVKSLATRYDYALDRDNPATSTLTATVFAAGLDPDRDAYRAQFPETASRSMTDSERGQIRGSVASEVDAEHFPQMTFTVTGLPTLAGTGTVPVTVNLKGAVSTVTLQGNAVVDGSRLVFTGDAELDGRPHSIPDPSGAFSDCVDARMQLKMRITLGEVAACTTDVTSPDAGTPFTPTTFPEDPQCATATTLFETPDPVLAASARDVLLLRCGGCHDVTPRFGATAPLTRWGDLHVDTLRNPGRPLHAEALERMAALPGSRLRMPPELEWDAVPEDEVTVFRTWVEAGACGQAQQDLPPRAREPLVRPRTQPGATGFEGRILPLLAELGEPPGAGQDGGASLETGCLKCHNGSNPLVPDFRFHSDDGGVVPRVRHPAYVGSLADGGTEPMHLWQAALARIRDHTMPPQSREFPDTQPSAEQVQVLSAWVAEGFPQYSRLAVRSLEVRRVGVDGGLAEVTGPVGGTLAVLYDVVTDLPQEVVASVQLVYGGGLRAVSPVDMPGVVIGEGCNGLPCNRFDLRTDTGELWDAPDYQVRVSVRQRNAAGTGFGSPAAAIGAVFAIANPRADGGPRLGTDLRYESAADAQKNVRRVFDTYCIPCHSPTPTVTIPGVPDTFLLDHWGTNDAGVPGAFSRRLRIDAVLQDSLMPARWEDGGYASPPPPPADVDLVRAWASGGAPR